jgi:hypothetical protein
MKTRVAFAVLLNLSLGVVALSGQQPGSSAARARPSLPPSRQSPPVSVPREVKKVSRDDVVREADSLMKNRKIAYLVGIGDYNRTVTGLTSLQYPVPDIMDVAKELEAQGYKVTTQIDRNATAGRIREDLRELAKLTTKGEGSFLFYYSGHGFAVGKENYLATYGTTAQDLEHQGLPVSELYDLLEATGARQRMAFIDACRNDPDSSKDVGRAAPRTIAEFDRAQGTAVLFSTEKGQVSYEDEKLGHGVFTYYVLSGLRGEAAGSDGFIAWTDLKRYVEDKMVDRSVAVKKSQVPYQVGEFTGDFLLGRRLATQTAQSRPVEVVPPSAQPAPQTAPPSEVASTRPGGAVATTSNATLFPQDGSDNQTARSIRSSGSMENVSKVWRSSADNKVYVVQLDPQNLVIRGLNRDIVADLQFQPNDKKYAYKGRTRLGAAASCPGGEGQVRMRVGAATATRLELDVEIPSVSQQRQTSCGFLTMLSSWQRVSFIIDN